MIDFYEACKIALDFYSVNLHVEGLAKAKDWEDRYIFYGGKPGVVNIGGVILYVMKEDGRTGVLEFPSKNSTQIIRNAEELSLPEEFVFE